MQNNFLLGKKEIRQRLLEKCRTLSDLKRELLESKMLTYLINWENFKKARSIHIFISKKYEPKTSKIIDLCWTSGIQISVPCVKSDSDELFHSKLNSFNDLSPGPFGVLEPTHNKRIKSYPKNFDIVIVPGIAFDNQGGRIGYGKGYYDRFLVKTRAFRLALAYDFQVLENLPTEKHDVTMHGILTESGITIFDN